MSLSGTSQIVERLAGAICLLAVGVSAIYCARKIGAVTDEAMVTLGKLDTTVDAINRPCGAGKPCGTLAEANKTMVKFQDVTVTLQRQVSQSATLVNASASAVNGAATDVHNLATAAQGTLNAGTGTLTAIQGDADALKPTLTSIPTTVVKVGTVADGVNDLVRSPDLASTMKHVEGMTASGDKMLADAQWKTHEILHPTPAKGIKAFFGGLVMWIHRLTPPIF